MKILFILFILLCSCCPNKDISNYEKQEFTKIAERMELISSDLQQGKLNKDEAITLYQMQGNSIRIALEVWKGLEELNK